MFLINGDYGDELEAGDSPLVIRPGWQAAYEEWDRRWFEVETTERENRLTSVGEGNVLLDNGQSLEYRKGENIAALVTPDGIEVPLHLDDNGNMIIPTPSEIAEMIANGEAEWVGHPIDTPPQLTEEEWNLQEVLRQLEEAASQQQ